MNESTLKGALMRTLRATLKEFVFIRHEDKFLVGIPDLSVTGCGWTSWWEIKYANPNCESTSVQDVMLGKLAKSGFARYIIYMEVIGQRRIFVLKPTVYRAWKRGDKIELSECCETVIEGFNHKELMHYISQIHHARKT